MKFLLLAALVPGLYWDQGTDTAAELKRSGITRLYVPAANAAAWRSAGFEAVPFTPGAPRCEAAEAPRVELRMDVASATNAPWIDANGWRFERKAGDKWCYRTPAGAAALAAAEAYAYGVDGVIQPAPTDLGDFARMVAFLRRIDRPPMEAMANIGVVDDGSDSSGEVLNLLARRNLLFRVVRSPDPKYEVNVEPREVEDPHEFAAEVRRKLGDERRWVRLYGSQVVIARLTGDGRRARLHVLNYSHRQVLGLRVRVRGSWRLAALEVFGKEKAAAADVVERDGGTEFTVAEMGPYAVADLER